MEEEDIEMSQEDLEDLKSSQVVMVGYSAAWDHIGDGNAALDKVNLSISAASVNVIIGPVGGGKVNAIQKPIINLSTSMCLLYV